LAPAVGSPNATLSLVRVSGRSSVPVWPLGLAETTFVQIGEIAKASADLAIQNSTSCSGVVVPLA